MGILCTASVRGFDLSGRFNEPALGMVDLQVVVDAKDVHDKGNSDTSTFGAQKSMAFTVSWMRSQLRKPPASLKWTSTENMWADGMTKAMDLTCLRKFCFLVTGRFPTAPSLSSRSTNLLGRSRKKPVVSAKELLGEPMIPDDPLLNHVLKLSEKRGFHFQDNIGVHVALLSRTSVLGSFLLDRVLLILICVQANASGDSWGGP